MRSENRPPTLEYVPRLPRATVRRSPLTASAYCTISTLPALGVLIMLAAQKDPRSTLLSDIAMLAGFLFASCTWLGIFVLHLVDLTRGIRPSSVLFDWKSRVALVMLSAFVAVLGTQPVILESSFAVSFFLAHLTLLAWLMVDTLRRRVVGKGTLLAIVAVVMLFGVSIQRCPHTTAYCAFGYTWKVSGEWCGNPKRFVPWWMAFGPL